MAAMTDDEIMAVLMLVASDGPLRSGQVGEGLTGRVRSGSARAHAAGVLAGLAAQGAVVRVTGPLGRGAWTLTEKGRIAAGLLLHKNPELRRAFIEAWER